MRIALQAVICLTVIALAGSVDGQDEATETLRLDKAELKRWVDFYQAEGEQYDIYLDEERTVKLTLLPEPVFRWASPNESNEFTGVVFIWHHKGRPEVVGSIWSRVSNPRPDKRTICHTFHSLASDSLHADRDGEPWWNPRTAGIEPKLIQGAPVPAKSAQLRLIQMRALSRAFSATQCVDRAETQEETLQLLPKPIYRFEADSDDAPEPHREQLSNLRHRMPSCPRMAGNCLRSTSFAHRCRIARGGLVRLLPTACGERLRTRLHR